MALCINPPDDGLHTVKLPSVGDIDPGPCTNLKDMRS